tara:strand:+ start:925 stop:1260 length:336 start_codon:yes stop_codon:yes gene_type:complete
MVLLSITLIILSIVFAGVVVVDYKNKNEESLKESVKKLSRINLQTSRVSTKMNWYLRYAKKHGVRTYQKINTLQSQKGKLVRTKIRSVFESPINEKALPSEYISHIQEEIK